MNLQDYPTPLTDEAERAESVSGYVDADFTRDLEQKLAACREALLKVLNSCLNIEHAELVAEEALTITSPQP